MLQRRQSCPTCGRCCVATISRHDLGLHLSFPRHRNPVSHVQCNTQSSFRRFSHA